MIKVLIIGCGAVGSVLAVRLSKVAYVTGYDIDRSVSSTFNKFGIRIIKDESCIEMAKIHIYSDARALKRNYFDLIVLATKAYDTIAAARTIKTWLNFKWILTIQNGYGNIQALSRFINPASIFCSVMTMAAQKISPGKTNLFYEGEIYFSSCLKTNKDASEKIGFLFSKSGFKIRMTNNCEGMIWSKLIFNAVMNPIPILLRDGYDAISKNKEVFRLVHEGVCEGKALAKRLGIRLVFDPLRIIRMIERGLLGPLEHKGSMFDDVTAGRKSEIDFLTGAIIKKAKRVGFRVPVLETIYLLINAIEKRT